MNKNEKLLIKYLSEGKYRQEKDTSLLVNLLINRGIKFKFSELNPVANIIDELEFKDRFKV